MRFKNGSLPELEPGDKALAERMLAGDEQAFEAFFDDHFPGLYRFTLARVRDPDLARDLVQSAICQGIANLRSYRGEASLASWLYTICRHEISRHFKKSGKRTMVELLEDQNDVRAALDSLPAAEDGPERDLDEKELAHLVHTTLDRLPPRYGRALEWKYLDGLSVREIAERLGLGPKAAESLLTRARNAFRDGFEAFGICTESRNGGTA